jgi:hypothetical protein
MRLWTIHPRYLDVKGLVSVWREGLLAQKVLLGKTKGYRSHSQLMRFRSHPRPTAAIATYLAEIIKEAKHRGYHFDSRKILETRIRGSMIVTEGQLMYEWHHLKCKLQKRNPQKYIQLKFIKKPDSHPLFRVIPGDVQEWERLR